MNVHNVFFKNMAIRVHNLNGTSDNSAPYPYCSWIRFWKSYRPGLIPTHCPRCGKLLYDPVGAHVQKDTLLDRKWYIVPICRGCNQANTSFDVESTLLVPVNP
jgi:hypothetical protein